ncbi:MAG: hypothetical protein ACRES9_01420 [Gammaproteobacteria bacterium]
MKRDFRNRDRRRRKGGWRFFASALLIAVAIFVIVKVIQHFYSNGGPQTAQNRAPVTATSVMPQPAESLAGFSLVMIRCRHSEGCPYYDLHVKGKSLKYTGVRGVAKRGNVTVPLAKARKREFLKLVQKARFFGLDSDYGLSNPACKTTRSAAPTVTIGVTLNGATKIVKANQACANVPPQLIALARGIDRLAHSSQWTRGAAPAPATGEMK